MSTQRWLTRRRALGALASVVATAGCSGVLGQVGGPGPGVSALVAGSLQRTFERLAGTVGPTVRVEAHGSVAAARLVASGKRDPELLALSDTDLLGGVVPAAWHAEFATNALVVAYDAASRGGRRVGRANRWFEPLVAGRATLGRTDPDLDPLGYRTLFALALAERHYDRPRLRERMLGPGQIYPETGLLSRFETGEVDAAVVYRNMAVERDYEYRELPAAVDLSDPARDDTYATVAYTLPDGRRVRGEHIAYGAQARSDDDATRRVFDALVEGSVLAEGGFGVPARYPVYRGQVPREYG